MTWLAAPLILAGALAAPPEGPRDIADMPSGSVPSEAAMAIAPDWTPASSGIEALTLAHPADRATTWRAPLRLPRSQQNLPDGPPVRETDSKHRSRNLLLGAVGAELVAGALLGGALATKGAYEDTDEPTRGLYRANRVMGHAGYASAIAGGAMVLGSISMWEW